MLDRRVAMALHFRTRGKPGTIPGWLITKQTPRQAAWAKSTHGAARVTHRVKEQWIATHSTTGALEVLTVWCCGSKCSTKIKIMVNPMTGRRPLRERCHLCGKP